MCIDKQDQINLYSAFLRERQNWPAEIIYLLPEQTGQHSPGG